MKGTSGRGWVGILLDFCFRAERSGVNRRRNGDGGVEPGEENDWVYPDIVQVNGTNYTDGRRGNLEYRNGEGGSILSLDVLRG